MSKWKCGICNTSFDNYQAQGFDNIIYCPVCYFKELYKREKNETKQLKKQKDDVVEYIKHKMSIKENYMIYGDFGTDLLRMLGEIE